MGLRGSPGGVFGPFSWGAREIGEIGEIGVFRGFSPPRRMQIRLLTLNDGQGTRPTILSDRPGRRGHQGSSGKMGVETTVELNKRKSQVPLPFRLVQVEIEKEQA